MKDNTKYGKYIQYTPDCGYEESLGPGIMKIDNSMCPGCNAYYVHFCVPGGIPKETEVGHPPHIHKENEMLFFIGLDPDNPEDLGGTFEFSFGEEMERHVIDKSCCLTIPSGLPHGRYIIHETRKPWLFVRVHESAARSELPRQDLLTEEERSKIQHPEHWSAVGFDEE